MRVFEQQPSETGKAYRAFAIYRDLGHGRTLDKAAAVYYGWHQESTKRAPGTFKRWSARFDWPARARAFDDWVEMIRRQGIEDHLRESGPELMRRQEALQEQVLRTKEKLLPQLKEMVEWPLYEDVVEHVETYPDGHTKTEVIRRTPARWSFDSLSRAIRVLDETPKVFDVRHLDFDKFSDEELDRILAGEDPFSILMEMWRKRDDGSELGP